MKAEDEKLRKRLNTSTLVVRSSTRVTADIATANLGSSDEMRVILTPSSNHLTARKTC
jgi:hypothetical protein